jgi:hypothetical protein
VSNPQRVAKWGATVQVSTEALQRAQVEIAGTRERLRALTATPVAPTPLVISPALAATLGVPADRASGPSPALVSLLLRAAA